MRNILVHDYGNVVLDRVWDVVQNHAPVMIDAIQQYLDSRGIRPGGTSGSGATGPS